jgi:DNA-binding IclR family transcriptional regulator
MKKSFKDFYIIMVYLTIHNGLKLSSHQDLLNELSKIRKAEMAITNFKNNHLVGFAVPICSNKKVIAGLSVFLPEYRCTAEKQKTIIESMAESARKIEQKFQTLVTPVKVITIILPVMI